MRNKISKIHFFAASLLLTSCSNTSEQVSLGYTSATFPRNNGYIHNSQGMTSHTPLEVASEGLSTGANKTEKAATKPVQIANLQHLPKDTDTKTENHKSFGPLLNPLAARNMINEFRTENGVKPLKLNDGLIKAARSHSGDMAKQDKISHIGSDGTDPMKRVLKNGYNANITAETVGTGQISFNELLERWKADPQHRQKLLLEEASDMGIALVHNPKSKSKTFWTLVLAGKNKR